MNDEKILNIRNNTEEAANYFSKKLAFTLGPVELKELSEEKNIKIIDVRLESDYQVGHIPGAISIPYEKMADKIQELNRDDLHIVYCYNNFCHLGARAAYLLAQNNYPVMELEGGFKTWYEDFRFAIVQ